MKRTITLFLLVSFAWSLCQAQCLQDRHNTSLRSNWVSCQSSVNPNPLRDPGHWILYDLGRVENLAGIHIWNFNWSDQPEMGIKLLAIDYSLDGESWSELGSYSLPIATATSVYQGHNLPEIPPVSGRFVILSAVSNYGGDCYGLGEVKFDLAGTTTSTEESEVSFSVDVLPNPFSGKTFIQLSDFLSETIQWSLYDGLGQTLVTGYQDIGGLSQEGFEIDGSELSNGYYFLTIRTKEGLITKKLVVARD